MAIFVIFLKSKNEEVEKKIQERYPTNYPLSENVFLVSDHTITKTIAQSIGIRKEAIETGVVFRLDDGRQFSAYSGYYSPDLWEWLMNEESRGSS